MHSKIATGSSLSSFSLLFYNYTLGTQTLADVVLVTDSSLAHLSPLLSVRHGNAQYTYMLVDIDPNPGSYIN
jgi:hypothetical protein